MHESHGNDDICDICLRGLRGKKIYLGQRQETNRRLKMRRRIARSVNRCQNKTINGVQIYIQYNYSIQLIIGELRQLITTIFVESRD